MSISKKALSRASFTSTASDTEYVKAEIEEEHIINDLLRANIQPAQIPALDINSSGQADLDLLLASSLMLGAGPDGCVNLEGSVNLSTGRRSIYEDDDDDDEIDLRSSTPTQISPKKGWVSLNSLQKIRNGTSDAPVNIEKIIRKTEADEEHLFLTMLKSQKRHDELETTSDSGHSGHSGGTGKRNGSFSLPSLHGGSQTSASLRTPLHSLPHSCSASNCEDDEEY